MVHKNTLVSNGPDTWQWFYKFVLPGSTGAILIPVQVAMIFRAQWNCLATCFSEQFPVIKEHVVVLDINLRICVQNSDLQLAPLETCHWKYLVYILCLGTVFLFIRFSVSLSGVLVFSGCGWGNTYSVSCRSSTGIPAFHLQHLYPNGDSSHSLSLACLGHCGHMRCVGYRDIRRPSPSAPSCYFTSVSLAFGVQWSSPAWEDSRGSSPLLFLGEDAL